MVGVRLHKDDLAALDQWVEMQPDHPSRPEAVRRLLKLALTLPDSPPPRS